MRGLVFLHPTTSRGVVLGTKRRRPEVRLTFLSPMGFDNTSLGHDTGSTGMQQSIALVVMVLLLVTLPPVEHEAHVVLDDGINTFVATEESTVQRYKYTMIVSINNKYCKF